MTEVRSVLKSQIDQLRVLAKHSNPEVAEFAEATIDELELD